MENILTRLLIWGKGRPEKNAIQRIPGTGADAMLPNTGQRASVAMRPEGAARSYVGDAEAPVPLIPVQ
uniref:Uncharacterized protein n=1 Tax=Romanomermis culicivorax TaxID=13658 RepID=A0A915JWZ4_ROMCU